MLFSDSRKRKIVATSTAQTVGRVHHFVVDPATRSVVAVGVKKAPSGNTLRWSDVVGFGADAVTVSGADRITDAPPEVTALTGKEHEILGKRALSTTGDDLGTVEDIDFDPTSGVITRMVMSTQDDIEGGRLVGVGSYAVVVASATV